MKEADTSTGDISENPNNVEMVIEKKSNITLNESKIQDISEAVMKESHTSTGEISKDQNNVEMNIKKGDNLTLKEFESTNILEEIVKEVDCDIDPQLCQDNMERLLGGLGLEPASNQHNEEEHGIDPHLCSASEEDVHQVPPGTSHLHQEHTAKSEDSEIKKNI